MNFWILCLQRQNMEQCIRINTFGLKRKYILGKVRIGDKIVCCAGKGDWKIIATGEVSSEYYLDDKEIFLENDVFPDRFEFTAVPLRKSQELDLKAILPNLSFIKKTGAWSVYFRNGIVQIPENDWKFIESQIAINNR